MVVSQFAHDPYNVFSLHAYFILYFIAPLARLIGSLQSFSALTALSFVAMPVASYVYIRKSGGSVWLALSIVVVCIIHPAWQISSGGQFYVDRLFMPLSMLYVFAVHSYLADHTDVRNTNAQLLLLLVLFGLLGGLTSERNMLVLAIFTGIYAVTSSTETRKRVILASLAVMFTAYVIVYSQVISQNPDTARVQTSIVSLSAISAAIMRTGIGEYLWFNGLLLVLPLLFVPRLFLAILPIMALNCFITVGGAEKNGWDTHYHSHYYGFLIASLVIAVSRVDRVPSFHGVVRNAIVPILMMLILILPIPIEYYKDRGIFLALWDFYMRSIQASSAIAQKAMFDELADKVPHGAAITSTEWGATAWFLRGSMPDIFPLGIGINEYVMIQALGDMPEIQLLSAVRYKPDKVAANDCFVPIMNNKYDLVARSGTWVLFKLK